MIATFYDTVPGGIRLLMALVLFVGISLIMLKIFHPQMLKIASKDGQTLPDGYHERGKAYAKAEEEQAAAEAAKAEAAEAEAAKTEETKAAEGAEGTAEGKTEEKKEEKKEKRYPPDPSYLAGRVIQITGLGFVFLMAFTLSNFWGNGQTALSAIQDETTHFHRAMTVAKMLPADQGGAEVVAGLEKYADSVINTEWPTLRRADGVAAMAAHDEAGLLLVGALQAAVEKGADKASGWGQISGSVDDLLSAGVDRINQLPGKSAPTIVIVVFVLAVANLALTMIFQPTRIGANMFLVAVMASITAFLLFFVTESANPFNGANALLPPLFG